MYRSVIQLIYSFLSNFLNILLNFIINNFHNLNLIQGMELSRPTIIYYVSEMNLRFMDWEQEIGRLSNMLVSCRLLFSAIGKKATIFGCNIVVVGYIHLT